MQLACAQGRDRPAARSFPSRALRLDALERRSRAGSARRRRASAVRADASLSFANEDVAGSASGSYSYGGDGPGRDRSQCAAVARQRPATCTATCRSPRSWASRAATGWSARSAAGQSSDARLRLLGDLRDFPFVDPAKGQFQRRGAGARGDARVRAGLAARRRHSTASCCSSATAWRSPAARARILGASVSNVHVAIAQLGAPGAELHGRGQCRGAHARSSSTTSATARCAGMIGGYTDAMSATRQRAAAAQARPAAAGARRHPGGGRVPFYRQQRAFSMPRLPPLERASGTISLHASAPSRSARLRGRMFGGPVALNGVASRGGDLSVDGTRLVLPLLASSRCWASPGKAY